jgi:NADH-quinone oxidoreductase subunit L
VLDLIWLLPTFPLLGFLSLVLTGGSLPKKIVAVIGVGSIGLSFLVAAIIAAQFLANGEAHFIKEVWVWMSVGSFSPGFTFYLDGLSLVMMLVITGIGFLIHLYSAGFMLDDPSYSRFFSYMNLFVASMLMLVLADNLVLLYLGWEGVGLCSYLLIGFWYENPANGYAARKAFVTTRVGDTSMAIGLDRKSVV